MGDPPGFLDVDALRHMLRPKGQCSQFGPAFDKHLLDTASHGSPEPLRRALKASKTPNVSKPTVAKKRRSQRAAAAARELRESSSSQTLTRMTQDEILRVADALSLPPRVVVAAERAYSETMDQVVGLSRTHQYTPRALGESALVQTTRMPPHELGSDVIHDVLESSPQDVTGAELDRIMRAAAKPAATDPSRSVGATVRAFGAFAVVQSSARRLGESGRVRPLFPTIVPKQTDSNSSMHSHTSPHRRRKRRLPQPSPTPRLLRSLDLDHLDSGAGISAIKHQLSRSTRQLDDVKGQIQTTFASVRSDIPLSALSKTRAGSVWHQWAAERLLVVMSGVYQRRMSPVLRKWSAYTLFMRNVDTIQSVRRVRGARWMGSIFLMMLDRSFSASFKHWVNATTKIRLAEWTRCTIAIQRACRGFVARRRVYWMARSSAAVRIQCMVRRVNAKQRVRALRDHTRLVNAVRTVERAYSSLRMARIVRRAMKLERRRRAAVTVQCAVRLSLARFAVRRKLREALREEAAQKIQRLVRGAAARYRADVIRGAQRSMHAVAVLQRVGRGMLGRQRARAERAKIEAARRIQKEWRDYVVRREEWRHSAAVKMQSVVRGRRGRIKAKKKRQWKAELRARELENAQERERRRLAAVLRLQCLARSIAAIKEWKRRQRVRAERLALERRREEAAVSLQCWVRCVWSRRMVAERRRIHLAKCKVALALQCRFRVIKAQARLRRRKNAFKREVVGIHSPYWQLHRKHVRVQEEGYGDMAVKIQAVARRHLASRRVHRIRVRLMHERRVKCAVLIQSVMRRKLAHRIVKEKVEIRNVQVEASVVIQKAARRVEAKRVVQARREYMRAIIRCQTVARRFIALGQARRRREELEARHFAALKIQCRVRGGFAREATRERMKNIAREKELMRRKREYNAAVMIQCAARMKLSRKAMRTRRQRRREELAEKEKDREVERQLNELHAQLEKDLLVMRIQCSARCMIARNRFRKQRVLFEKKLKEKKEARRTRAATCIQAYFRACVVRSWYRRNVEELRRKQQAMRRLTDMRKKALAQLEDIETQVQYVNSFGAPEAFIQRLPEPSTAADQNEEAYGDQSFELNELDTTVEEDYTPHDQYDDGQYAWSKYYDESAQAYYWYNETTGEASWTHPAETG